jgi:Protein of unknown function (DUF1579)
MKICTLCLTIGTGLAVALAAGAALQPEKLPSPRDLKDKAKEAVKDAKDAMKQPEGQPGDLGGMDPKAMEAMTKAAMPGDMHKMLGELVGEWDFVNNFRMAPEGPEMSSNGTATHTSLYEGRYIQVDMKGDMMGAPFLGRAMQAFNNVSGKFESTWIDNFGTGIMFGTGTYDAAKKQLTTVMNGYDPMTGKPMEMTEVTTHHDKDHFTSEYTMPGPDGKPFKGMTIKYTRKGHTHDKPTGKPEAKPALAKPAGR